RSQWEREFNNRLDELNAPRSAGGRDGEGTSRSGEEIGALTPTPERVGRDIARFGESRGMSPQEARGWGDRYADAQHNGGAEARNRWEREFENRLDELKLEHEFHQNRNGEDAGGAGKGAGNSGPSPDRVGMDIAKFGERRGMSPQEARGWADRYAQAQRSGDPESQNRWEREFDNRLDELEFERELNNRHRMNSDPASGPRGEGRGNRSNEFEEPGRRDEPQGGPGGRNDLGSSNAKGAGRGDSGQDTGSGTGIGTGKGDHGTDGPQTEQQTSSSSGQGRQTQVAVLERPEPEAPAAKHPAGGEHSPTSSSASDGAAAHGDHQPGAKGRAPGEGERGGASTKAPSEGSSTVTDGRGHGHDDAYGDAHGDAHGEGRPHLPPTPERTGANGHSTAPTQWRDTAGDMAKGDTAKASASEPGGKRTGATSSGPAHESAEPLPVPPLHQPTNGRQPVPGTDEATPTSPVTDPRTGTGRQQAPGEAPATHPATDKPSGTSAVPVPEPGKQSAKGGQTAKGKEPEAGAPVPAPSHRHPGAARFDIDAAHERLHDLSLIHIS
ncbi:hypothetical protein ADK38_25480, partial [Streptomyces varsoviensis]